MNRLFVLSFEDINVRKTYKRYFLPTAETKDYNVMIDGTFFFYQVVKTDSRIYDKVQKLGTG